MRIEVFADGGQFAPGRIAEVLRTTRDEVARTVGLGRDAVMRPDVVAGRHLLVEPVDHEGSGVTVASVARLIVLTPK